MKKIFYQILVLLVLLSACKTDNNKITTTAPSQTEELNIEKKEWALVIHGGAGTILKENMTPEKEKAYRDKLSEVLAKGEEILASGGSALDAVEQCIQIMEASPLFNAGKGAVFTNAGTNEMDASIMDGSDLNAGAVAGVTVVKSPIAAARKVMEASPHVMLSGKGADKFAEEEGLEIVDPSYFYTKDRFESLERAKSREREKQADQIAEASAYSSEDYKFGTVGVVCLDKKGNLAAGTSTGGMTNKRWGRIGDSPIIGAGTYANNESCAVSATGHGEFFIRANVAHEISALFLYKELSIDSAANELIHHRLMDMGAAGGVIALDKYGNHAMPFNTPGMYRGFINADGESGVFLYENEAWSKE
ncbi:MAG: beta-aspartyl-peptidase [Flavobacteriales bacterium]|nr:beta-aspartyl-peptidase [Flavobacteriales bacterium]